MFLGCQKIDKSLGSDDDDDDDGNDDDGNDDVGNDDEKEGLCVWVVSDMVRGITAWQEAITADSRIAFLHTATVENTKEILKKYLRNV